LRSLNQPNLVGTLPNPPTRRRGSAWMMEAWRICAIPSPVWQSGDVSKRLLELRASSLIEVSLFSGTPVAPPLLK
jgi:hypothetical protein